ncbi:hypothetical protein E2C01_090529 [Portunus trituberculatus]|uniref:Uncharacterized protein n=1 Tax=Portunus trituberculatus TaxID=210409 RepID=A0A5B7JGU0_PORTR|nr:hypothetical protein [Portunus trituberculatus]
MVQDVNNEDRPLNSSSVAEQGPGRARAGVEGGKSIPLVGLEEDGARGTQSRGLGLAVQGHQCAIALVCRRPQALRFSVLRRIASQTLPHARP